MTTINKMIHNEVLFKYITEKELNHNKTSEVESTGFVDDLSHTISNKNIEQLELTTSDAQELVTSLYNENLLKVNRDKTHILQIEKNTSDVDDQDRQRKWGGS